MQTRGEPQDHRGHQGPETKSHHRSDARHHCHAGSFIPGTWVKEESSARPHKQTQRHPLVRKTYDNLFWLFSAPHGTRRPHRIRLLGGGFRPIERGRDSLAHHRGARTEQGTAVRSGVRSVVPSARVLPGPLPDAPSLLSPRGGDGGCDVVQSDNKVLR